MPCFLSKISNALVFFVLSKSLICFYIDLDKVTAKIEKKNLDENKITVEQVEICSSVLVTGLPDNTSEDTILYYFENSKRSGGGEVSKVDFNPEQKRAVVHFLDSEGTFDHVFHFS